MKLSELNELLSLFASLGVLAGIFILVLEISQNTRAIENDAFWSRVNASQNVLSTIVENPEVAELMLTYGSDPDFMNAPITPDILRAQVLFEMIVRQTEARFVTQSDDLDAMRAATIRYLNQPGMREFFKSQLDLFTPEFAEFVDGLINQLENN